jgi:hypothetical protein
MAIEDDNDTLSIRRSFDALHPQPSFDVHPAYTHAPAYTTTDQTRSHYVGSVYVSRKHPMSVSEERHAAVADGSLGMKQYYDDAASTGSVGSVSNNHHDHVSTVSLDDHSFMQHSKKVHSESDTVHVTSTDHDLLAAMHAIVAEHGAMTASTMQEHLERQFSRSLLGNEEFIQAHLEALMREPDGI